MVSDLPDSPDFGGDNHLKSIFAIRESHVNLFVLTFSGQSMGVAREVEYIIRNPQFVFKSVLLIETEYDADMNQKREAFSSMYRPDVTALGFKVGYFKRNDREDLFEETRGLIDQLFYYYAKNNQPSLDKPSLI